MEAVHNFTEVFQKQKCAPFHGKFMESFCHIYRDFRAIFCPLLEMFDYGDISI